jgi:hypothetical protein
MSVTKFPEKKPVKTRSEFKEFSKYENGRIRFLQFDVNALADFEEKTGMGFAQLMQQKAVFASARAMLWAGLKRNDRALTIEYVGDLISMYLKDEDVPRGEHTVDTLLMVTIGAAAEQGALGRPVEDEPAPTVEEQRALAGGSDPNVLDAQAEAEKTSDSPANGDGPTGSPTKNRSRTANSN